MLKRLFYAFLFLACVVAPVGAALWPNFPIVGGAAYCTSYGGASGTTCITTAPAGPSALPTGTTIPADTNLSSGQSPQTVKLTLHSLNAMPVGYRAYTPATTGNAATATTTEGGIIIVGTGALSATTLTLPPTPIDGQQFYFSSTHTIAALTVTAPASATVSNAPTAITVSTTGAYGYRWQYRASNTTWYRMQ